jgi:hypothetical protein
VVVVGTWLQKYLLRKNGLPRFEDYETHKKIVHYSHFVVATNIKLNWYHGRPTNKELWRILHGEFSGWFSKIINYMNELRNPNNPLESLCPLELGVAWSIPYNRWWKLVHTCGVKTHGMALRPTR